MGGAPARGGRPAERHGRNRDVPHLSRSRDGWLARLFDYKPFLVFLCLLPTVGLLVVFLTYPLGLGIWLSLTDTTIGQPGHSSGSTISSR